MNTDQLKDFAQRTEPDEFMCLLKAYGDHEALVAGVDAYDRDTERQQKKLALIFDYLAKRGPFEEKPEASADAMKQLRENVADLTRQVRALQDAAATRDVVKGLRAEIESAAAAKRAPTPGQL